MRPTMSPEGVDVSTEPASSERILTADAIGFLEGLHGEFEDDRIALLAARVERRSRLAAGETFDFLSETATVRDEDWRIEAVPDDLQDRRVEITGPTDPKMLINALNSGARCFMADFEDANSPTWENMVGGQANLVDAVARTLTHSQADGRTYELNDELATLIVRPRGWHLVEKHLSVDGTPISGSLFDFGLYLFHNAAPLEAAGSGPYFYLPKLEGHLEARLWSRVLCSAEDSLGLTRGTIKVTVLIETLPAAFEMDEILFELRDHIVGLNCGRWDYIFSYIKKFRNRPEFVLPDRAQVGMTCHFLQSYSLQLIKTCHRRGAFAMGGMAAQIPIKNDEDANNAALAKVLADKEREVTNGHDGTWVAHPGLVPIAKGAFDVAMTGDNQLSRQRQDVNMKQSDLLRVHTGTITEDGLRMNLSVGTQYVEAWLRGNGCVPLYNLMEDAATAEISRAQVWQWLKHQANFTDGPAITAETVRGAMAEELDKIREEVGADVYDNGKYTEAGALFLQMVIEDEFQDFLTLPAYERIITTA